MKRSEINRAYRQALACFLQHGWALPPRPRWDITDFGLGDFPHYGLTCVNLATEPEYCEKLMYASLGQTTPCHTHRRKKEDIICRAGRLVLRLWPERPSDGRASGGTFRIQVDGEPVAAKAGEELALPPGSRVTLVPGVWHEFRPASPDCIIGEVSTANDDRHDNVFLEPRIGRFPGIEEDEEPQIRLLSEPAATG